MLPRRLFLPSLSFIYLFIYLINTSMVYMVPMASFHVNFQILLKRK